MRNAIVFILLLGHAPFVYAAPELNAAQERDAQALFSSLLSPFCPGRLISDCPSEKASVLKDEIRTELASGKSPEAVTQQLYLRFGEKTLRSMPEEKGFGLLAWIFPVVFFVLGLGILLSWLRSLQKADSSPVVTESAEHQELEARVRRELEDV